MPFNSYGDLPNELLQALSYFASTVVVEPSSWIKLNELRTPNLGIRDVFNVALKHSMRELKQSKAAF